MSAGEAAIRVRAVLQTVSPTSNYYPQMKQLVLQKLSVADSVLTVERKSSNSI